jgi:hypothetical protein
MNAAASAGSDPGFLQKVLRQEDLRLEHVLQTAMDGSARRRRNFS